MAKAWKPAKLETYKQVYISKGRNIEERNKIKELREEAKEENELRTEEEKKTFLLESNGHEIKEMVHKRRPRINDGLKVAYTNVNGLRSSTIEIGDYLREQQPDIHGDYKNKIDR